MGYEPKVLVFLCNWCSYAGADLAGVSRVQYPSNVRLVRVMCSGRVDPIFVLEALKQGADGVMITGCHPSECHYEKGNYLAEARMKFLKQSLQEIGLQPERVRVEWISASEGRKFASVVQEMVEKVRELGANPLKMEGR